MVIVAVPFYAILKMLYWNLYHRNGLTISWNLASIIKLHLFKAVCLSSKIIPSTYNMAYRYNLSSAPHVSVCYPNTSKLVIDRIF